MPTAVEYQAVSRELFPVGKEINESYIRLLHGLACKDWQPSDFAAAVDEVKQNRNNARSWGKATIEAKIVAAAKEAGIDARNMVALKNQFKQDCSPQFAARLWSACYGCFDLEPRWEYALETQYMDFAHFVYESKEDTGSNERKGCIARLFCEVRKEIVKAINRAGKTGHGGTIRVKRTAAEVEKTGKHTRRKKGETLCDFFSLEVAGTRRPEELIERDEKKQDFDELEELFDDDSDPDDLPKSPKKNKKTKTKHVLEDSSSSEEDTTTTRKKNKKNKKTKTKHVLEDSSSSEEDTTTTRKKNKKHDDSSEEPTTTKREIALLKRIESLRRSEQAAKRELKKVQQVVEQGDKKKEAANKKEKADKNKDVISKFKKKADKNKDVISKFKKKAVQKKTPERTDDSSTSTETFESSSAVSVDCEVVTDSDDSLPSIKIHTHRVKGKNIDLKVKFSDEKTTTWVAIHLIWADYKDDLFAYIKENKLKGGYWRKPALRNVEEIKQVLDHKEKNGKHTHYQVLWDNGFVDWGSAADIVADADSKIIEAYKKIASTTD